MATANKMAITSRVFGCVLFVPIYMCFNRALLLVRQNYQSARLQKLEVTKGWIPPSLKCLLARVIPLLTNLFQ